MALPSPGSSIRARYWPIAKCLLLTLVLAFITRRAVQIWMETPRETVHIHGSWLVLASLAYLIGWLPSVWFWREMLLNLRQPVGIWPAIRAYYVGHLGKYVPGKALVLVIRASLLKDLNVNPLTVGMAVVFETIVFMSTGFVLAVAFGPLAFGDQSVGFLPDLSWIHNHPLVVALVVGVVTFATTPISAYLLTRLCRKTVPKEQLAGLVQPSISAGLISQGIAVTSLGWLFHALSLGFVLQSISEKPFELTQFPVWLVSCALSTVGGFVVLFAPGGLGVREGLLFEALKDQPSIGPKTAIIAAGLLRAVWFATELIAAGILFVLRKSRRRCD